MQGVDVQTLLQSTVSESNSFNRTSQQIYKGLNFYTFEPSHSHVLMQYQIVSSFL